jgi:hypothetical protein
MIPAPRIHPPAAQVEGNYDNCTDLKQWEDHRQHLVRPLVTITQLRAGSGHTFTFFTLLSEKAGFVDEFSSAACDFARQR